MYRGGRDAVYTHRHTHTQRHMHKNTNTHAHTLLAHHHHTNAYLEDRVHPRLPERLVQLVEDAPGVGLLDEGGAGNGLADGWCTVGGETQGQCEMARD